tara:strand:- start:2652 stop:2867 length:216 start_codon:yes stop_codon:yes gene_type:complete
MAIVGMVGRQLIKLGLSKEARRKVKKGIQQGHLKVSGKEIKMTPKGSYKQQQTNNRELKKLNQKDKKRGKK